ncbi:MAG: hypothetical protein ACRDTG_07985, partial [Pseudonocardiaceae bacterium]
PPGSRRPTGPHTMSALAMSWICHRQSGRLRAGGPTDVALAPSRSYPECLNGQRTCTLISAWQPTRPEPRDMARWRPVDPEPVR